MQALSTEAAMGPIREIAQQRRGNLQHVRTADIPMLTIAHFHAALQVVKPSVSPHDLQRYEDWNNLFGSYKTR
ncbi:hypothetical protein EON65_37900 [archaeon]|nr:MAG: hypothetical protein EON65_37900 [archaeon]